VERDICSTATVYLLR